MNCTAPVTDVASIDNFTCLFGKVVSYALGLAAIVLFILLISGGFKFIFSGGDPKATEGAKKTITYAIAGLIMILLSYLILVFIKTITGVDVTNFAIVQP